MSAPHEYCKSLGAPHAPLRLIVHHPLDVVTAVLHRHLSDGFPLALAGIGRYRNFCFFNAEFDALRFALRLLAPLLTLPPQV